MLITFDVYDPDPISYRFWHPERALVFATYTRTKRDMVEHLAAWRRGEYDDRAEKLWHHFLDTEREWGVLEHVPMNNNAWPSCGWWSPGWGVVWRHTCNLRWALENYVDAPEIMRRMREYKPNFETWLEDLETQVERVDFGDGDFVQITILRDSSPAISIAFDGVSRVFTHQLVRHRMASYLQKTGRVLDLRDFRIPPSIGRLDDLGRAAAISKIREAMEILDGLPIPNEDRRYLYPQGVKTGIVMTTSRSQLEHIIEMRTHPEAQWEIREVFSRVVEMLGWDLGRR